MLWFDRKKEIKKLFGGGSSGLIFYLPVLKTKRNQLFTIWRTFLVKLMCATYCSVVIWQKKKSVECGYQIPKIECVFILNWRLQNKKKFTNRFEDFFLVKLMETVKWVLWFDRKNSLLECGEQIPKIPKIRRWLLQQQLKISWKRRVEDPRNSEWWKGWPMPTLFGITKFIMFQKV